MAIFAINLYASMLVNGVIGSKVNSSFRHKVLQQKSA
jgi:hypothetical protein